MDMSERLRTFFPYYPMLYGHRGCSKAAPENTMPAFEKILTNNIPGVELDVHICGSGELVVTHDSNLKRVSGVDKQVSDMNYADIRALDVGSWFSSDFAGEHIPRLEDVLDLLGDKVIIDIEIKHWEQQSGELERKVAEVVGQYNLLETATVTSFNPYSLKAIKEHNSNITTALIYTEHESIPQWLHDGSGRYICNPDFLKPNRLKIGKELIELEQETRKIPLVTWTEDDPEVIRRFLDLGISGVITNTPETLLPMFSEYWAQIRSK